MSTNLTNRGVRGNVPELIAARGHSGEREGEWVSRSVPVLDQFTTQIIAYQAEFVYLPTAVKTENATVLTTPSPDDAAEEARGVETLRRVSLRSIPLLMIAYIIAFIDRSNAGFAAITASKDLNMSPEVFGFGVGVFFIGYLIFEVPSNYLMERIGARRWLARIMVTCAIVSASMVFVTDKWSFYVVRFLLGVVEAGLFPGVMLYLTYWFPRRYRARYAGMFAMGIPLASVVGSPISGLILDGLNGVWGFKGWQWLYIVEALPGALLGVLIWALLDDRPEDARWLEARDREWIIRTMARERADQPESAHKGLLESLRLLADRRVILLSVVFFLTAMPSYGLSLWLPQILKSFAYDNVTLGFINTIPFACGCVAMLWWARRSDRLRERDWHTAIAASIAAIGMVACIGITSPKLTILALSVSAVGTFGLKGPFLSRVSESFSRENAAVGIAICVSIGNLSGLAAPWLTGAIKERVGSYAPALVILGLCSFAGALLILLRPAPGIIGTPVPRKPAALSHG